MQPDRALPAHPVSRGRRLLRSIGSLILRAAVAVALAGALAPRAEAQRRPVSFIRDAEVEATIRSFAAPLFAAASLDPAAISVHLVNDRSLNAFVANGLHMYLNTGLLMRSDNAGQVIGVIAHETGHIQGGHLVQMREQISQSMVPMILEMLATFGAAGAGMRPGNPNDWGGVRGGGGPTVTERFLLRYSRGMENQADQAAITLLERTGQSPRGLKEFLEILADQVRCSHGATTGEINPEELFYMQARGISERDALRLITYGFLNEVIERLPENSLRVRLQEALQARLQGH